jgi:Zn-dependent protease/CBS domain-containing protein
MRWSFRIATVSGIPIYVHATFVALIAFLFLSDWMHGRDVRAAFAGVLYVLAIFGAVVLHEFGHALMARRYGIRTRDITLLPIGGLARLERLPSVPRQELWVALAGPAVNVALAVIAGVLIVLLPDSPFVISAADRPRLDRAALGLPTGVLPRFLVTNIWLALFNLIPAFPMDGGRALRAILAERMDYVRATEKAATLGQGLALILGFIGLFTNPFLLFIALFVWMGASTEASSVSVRAAIQGIPVARAMITDFRALDASESLQEAARLVIAGSQRDFPVLEERRLVGVLTRDALVRGLAERGLSSPVRDAMSSDFETIDARDMLEHAIERLQACQCPVLPVLDDGRLAGLLTADNVGEFVMIRGAIAPGRRQAVPRADA